MNPLRIFIADDHALLRAGLKRLIESEPNMIVVGEAGDGIEAFDKIIELNPEITVMDISMPKMNGVEVIRRLKAAGSKTKVIAVTVQEDSAYLREVFEAGSCGYLLKRAAADELIEALGKIAAGSFYVDPRIEDKLINSLVTKEENVASSVAKLSERERLVLQLIAQGHSNKEIAGQLELSVKTIETYKTRAMEKLRLRSRVDIVRHAHSQGWLSPAPSKDCGNS